MPVILPNDLPAVTTLALENIFTMTSARAYHQDIRPLRIAIVNLMPTKEVTETQLLRLVGNTPLQIDVTLLRMASHTSRNTSATHLSSFYKTFEQVKSEPFDGLIITGAPVEQLDFEEVTYWNELTDIIDWAQAHVFSTLYICWAAQAGLYIHHGINKRPLASKCFGVFEHETLIQHNPITRGFDETFFAPHSRHTEVRAEDIAKVSDLQLLAVSRDAGVYLVSDKTGRHVFVTGHSEYDRDTLHKEYVRDMEKGLPIDVPCNYYPNDDYTRSPIVRWRAHAHLLYSNWLNYCVYQETPYDINAIRSFPGGM